MDISQGVNTNQVTMKGSLHKYSDGYGYGRRVSTPDNTVNKRGEMKKYTSDLFHTIQKPQLTEEQVSNGVNLFIYMYCVDLKKMSNRDRFA